MGHLSMHPHLQQHCHTAVAKLDMQEHPMREGSFFNATSSNYFCPNNRPPIPHITQPDFRQGKVSVDKLEWEYLNVSQLEIENLRSSYRVSQSLIWYWGGAGVSLSNADSPGSVPPSSSSSCFWKKFILQARLSLLLDKPARQRSLMRPAIHSPGAYYDLWHC